MVSRSARRASAAGAITSARPAANPSSSCWNTSGRCSASIPNADGLMIESSDYAICHCPDCGPHFFEKEFAFVKRISEEVWSKKPDAMIVVYPHYFSGTEVPGFGVKAAKQPFDPRWTLFFTPHSAHLDPDLIKQARSSLWWDDSPALRRPQDIQQGARRARDAGVTGYVPSLEAYRFIATVAEEGQAWLKGRRQVPLGFGWLAPGDPPYDELPMRVNRIAYREFSRNPDLPFERYKEILGREVFGEASTPQLVDDLLTLQAVFATERTWCQPSPLVCPERVRAMKDKGELTAVKRDGYRRTLDQLRAIEGRHREPRSEGEKELHRIARWVLDRWTRGGPEAPGLAHRPKEGLSLTDAQAEPRHALRRDHRHPRAGDVDGQPGHPPRRERGHTAILATGGDG